MNKRVFSGTAEGLEHCSDVAPQDLDHSCANWEFSMEYSFGHRIGWWENLQESPIFDGKNHGFL